MPPPTSAEIDEVADDRPARALGLHLVGRGLDDIEGAVEIDLDGALQQRRRQIEKRVERADAGVGGEDVDLAEGGDGGGDEVLRCFGPRDVALDRDRAAPERADLADDGVDRGALAVAGVVVAPEVQGDVGAVARGGDRDAGADAARGAGDDDGLAFEQHRRLSSPQRAFARNRATPTILIASKVCG